MLSRPLKTILTASAVILTACAQGENKPSAADKNSKYAAANSTAQNTNPKASGLGQTLKIAPTPEDDAVDYTFGVSSLLFEPNRPEVSFKQTRALITDGTLSPTLSDSLAPICRDIGISTDPHTFALATEWKKGQKLYLMWRSHYPAALKQTLADLVTTGNPGVECLLHLVYNNDAGIPQNVNLVLDPIPSQAQGFAGSTKLDQAVASGLLLPQLANSLADFPSGKLTPVTDAPKFNLSVLPLSADKFTVKTNPVVGEQCYYATGTTRVANPYGSNSVSYEFSSDVDAAPTGLKAKAIAGRIYTQCQGLKPTLTSKSITLDITCDEYQKIKEQGMEAGCAWDVTVTNPADPDNTLAVPLLLAKLTYRTIDPSKVDQALQLVPQSPENPIRKNSITLRSMSPNQTTALSDMFDLWLALDPESFHRDFEGQVQSIQFGDPGVCASSGAYTPYGGDVINWCQNGESSEASTGQRFKNPTAALYRAVLFYHEARHAKNLRHDYEVASYAACQGTSLSASLIYIVGTKCDYDYCKAFKSALNTDYRLELDYDFNGDTTGRKGSGLCKTWSSALGISGNGY